MPDPRIATDRIRPKTPPKSSSSSFSNLIKEGSTLPGDFFAVDNPTEIPWFDPILFEKGRQFVQNNYAALQLTLMAANCMGFCAKQIAAVFFKNFYPNNTCGVRFLSTFRSEAAFLFSTNPTDPDSAFIKETRRVKKLHKIWGRPKQAPLVPPPKLENSYPAEYSELLELLRKDLKDLDISDYPEKLISWTPANYFTQLDVALVQFGPLAPLLLCPEAVGLYKKFEQDEGLRGYFHIWAVVGSILGLEDRFNLALLAPDRDLYWDIVNKVGLPSLRFADETVIFAMSTLVTEVSKMMPGLVTMKSLIYSGLRANGVAGDNLRGSMGLRDRISLALLQVTVYLMRFTVFRWVANTVIRNMFGFYYKIYLGKQSCD